MGHRIRVELAERNQVSPRHGENCWAMNRRNSGIEHANHSEPHNGSKDLVGPTIR